MFHFSPLYPLRTLAIPAKSNNIIMAGKKQNMSAIATRVINQDILISHKHAYWHVNENFQRSDPCAVMRNGTLILMSGSVITHVCPITNGATSRSTLPVCHHQCKCADYNKWKQFWHEHCKQINITEILDEV